MNKLKMRVRKKVRMPGLSERYFEFQRGEPVRVDDLNTMGYARVSSLTGGKYFWIAQEDLHKVTAST
jgi:hypothetical protein